jgi:hypothetical protein
MPPTSTLRIYPSATVFFVNFCSLHSDSPPRREAASSPLPWRGDSKKAVTGTDAVECEFLEFAPRILQFNWVTWPRRLILGLKGRFGQ